MTEESRFKTLRNSITQVGESKININTVLASAMQPLGPGCLYFSAAWLEPVAEKAQLYHEWNSATKISCVKITDKQDLARECLHVLALLFSTSQPGWGYRQKWERHSRCPRGSSLPWVLFSTPPRYSSIHGGLGQWSKRCAVTDPAFQLDVGWSTKRHTSGQVSAGAS